LQNTPNFSEFDEFSDISWNAKILEAEVTRRVVIVIASVTKLGSCHQLQGFLPAIPCMRNQEHGCVTLLRIQDASHHHTHSLSHFDSTIPFNYYFLVFLSSAAFLLEDAHDILQLQATPPSTAPYAPGGSLKLSNCMIEDVDERD
jgi:hypothetical protein